METVTMNTEEMIQVGATSMRRPDRSFLPSVPLFIRASDYETLLDQRQTERGETKEEARNEIAEMFRPQYEKQKEMEAFNAAKEAARLQKKQEKEKEKEKRAAEKKAKKLTEKKEQIRKIYNEQIAKKD